MKYSKRLLQAVATAAFILVSSLVLASPPVINSLYCGREPAPATFFFCLVTYDSDNPVEIRWFIDNVYRPDLDNMHYFSGFCQGSWPSSKVDVVVENSSGLDTADTLIIGCTV